MQHQVMAVLMTKLLRLLLAFAAGLLLGRLTRKDRLQIDCRGTIAVPSWQCMASPAPLVSVATPRRWPYDNGDTGNIEIVWSGTRDGTAYVEAA